ncbi:GDSL-type esterase/lipase family protein [Gordonia sp. NPDC057258]|uniref:GDSL-type esterase/lipase family protein n=1 Tax=unclassified Gordonia (in: high G+C Gram-positive bacteria) TaxID=2657482 RepID=UPI003643DE3C
MSSAIEHGHADKRLRTDATVRILARVASSAMLGVFLLLLARALPVDTFGQYILAYTLGVVVGLAAGFGAPIRVMRLSASDDTPTAAALFVAHTVPVSGVFLVATAGLILAGLPVIVVAGVLFAYSDTVQNFAQSFLAGTHAHTAASCLVVVQRAVPLVVWGGLALSGIGLDAAALAVIFSCTAVTALVVPAVPIGVRGLRRAIRELRRPGAETVRYWALAMSGTLAQLQVSALAVFATPLTVGYFAMATRVTGPLTLLSAALSTVAVPELARTVDDASAFDRIYCRYRNLVIVYCVVVIVAAWPAAWAVVHVVGTKYEPAQLLLTGVIIAAGISSLSQAISAKHIAAGRPDTVTAAIVLGGGATLALLLLAGALDHVGAIWLAPIAGQLLVLAALLSDVHEGGRMTRLVRTHWEKALLAVTVVVLTATAGVAFAVAPEPATDTAPHSAGVQVTSAASTSRSANGGGFDGAATTDAAVKILVVGDSFTEGTTYGGKGSSNWTRIAQGRLSDARPDTCPVLLRVSGRGGAGYLTTGIRHTTFASEAQRLLTPDVSAIVLVGSGNDLSHPSKQYRAAVDDTIRAVRKARPDLRVVIVGLSWIHDGPTAPDYLRANRLLADAAKRHGVAFIDPNRSGWYSAPRDHSIVGADQRHPTDEGHALIAEHMTPVLEGLARKGRCA